MAFEAGWVVAVEGGEGTAAFGFFDWLFGSTAGAVLTRTAILSVAARALIRSPGGIGHVGGVLSAQGRNLSVRQTIAPWQVIIGQSRAGGEITFVFLDSNRKYLHIVVTFACHVSEEIGDVWLDDQIITPGMLDGTGVVTSGKFSLIEQVVHSEFHTVSANQATVNFSVASVQGVWVGNTQETALIDVSPAAPSSSTEYSRSGSVFTFSGLNGFQIEFAYTENAIRPVCRIQKSLGGEAGQPFPDLQTESEGKWTADHKQSGHTKIYIRFDTKILETGTPQISAVIRGQKLYDPRTTLTTWSANPSLALLSYITNTEYGLGASLSETSSADFIAAADVCDERVTLATATTTFTADATSNALTLATGARLPLLGDGIRVSSSGTLPSPLAAATTYFPFYTAGLLKLATSYANALAGTAIDITTAGTGTHTLTYYDEFRYRANGVFRVSERPVDILERLLASMAGMLVQVSDSWRVFPGAYEAATITLTESDFAGPIQIEKFPSRDKWANGAKGVFVNPAANWQATDFPAIAPTTPYLDEDGNETIWADLDLSSYVASSAQAQRLARIEIRRRRSGLTVTATFKLTAWRALTGRSVALTFAKYGWTAKEFTILDASFVVVQNQDGPALGIQLVLRETNSAIYTWSAEDAAQGTPPSTSLPSPFTAPAAISGLSAASTGKQFVNGDGTIITRVEVTWTAITDGISLGGHLEMTYAHRGDPAPQISTSITPTSTLQYIDGLEDGTWYLISMRAISAVGIAGPWATVAHLVNPKAVKPANVGTLSFTDPILSWPPNTTDDDLAGYIVRYQPNWASTDWSTATLAHQSGFITETQFDTSRIIGGQITMLVKAIDTTGNESTAVSSKQIDLRPGTPTTLSFAQQADGTRQYTFALSSPPADLDGFMLRYFLGSTSDWNAMTGLHAGVLRVSPFESNALAAGTYTFAAKSIDKAGNESASALFTGSTVLGPPRLTDGYITAKMFASTIGPIEIFGSLPTSGNFEGRVVYLTTDDKLYRYDGAAFVKTTDGADLVANSVTAAKLNVAQLAAISADLGEVTAGSIRGVNVNAASHTTKGSYITSALTGGETTVNVRNTADFAASGSGVIIDTTNDRDAFTYTGKTATTLTGCSGVLAHNNGATIIPFANAMVIDAATNEMRFYGDNGTGAIAELAKIGLGADNACVVGGVRGTGMTRIGVFGQSTDSYAVLGQTDGSGPGVVGTSGTGIGGQFDGNATKGNLTLNNCNASTFPTNKAATQVATVGGRQYYSDGSHWYPLMRAYFESSETALGGGSSTTTIAHGLTDGAGNARVPNGYQVFLRCKTAEFGYAVGDEIELGSGMTAAFMTVYADATNIGIVESNNTQIVRRDNFANGAITEGNWKLVARAW